MAKCVLCKTNNASSSNDVGLCRDCYNFDLDTVRKFQNKGYSMEEIRKKLKR